LEEWAEIRRLHRAEGMPIRAIARRLGMGRNTVRRALAAEGPPRYQRPARGSVVDAVESRIRELLAAWPLRVALRQVLPTVSAEPRQLTGRRRRGPDRHAIPRPQLIDALTPDARFVTVLGVSEGSARRAELGVYRARELTIFLCTSSGTSKKGH
jgi:transposase